MHSFQDKGFAVIWQQGDLPNGAFVTGILSAYLGKLNDTDKIKASYSLGFSIFWELIDDVNIILKTCVDRLYYEETVAPNSQRRQAINDLAIAINLSSKHQYVHINRAIDNLKILCQDINRPRHHIYSDYLRSEDYAI